MNAATDSTSPLFLITHEFYPRRGGIATFTEEMAKASVELGYDVEVWAQRKTPHHKEKNWPFRIRRLPLHGTHDLACQVRLVRELISQRRRLRNAIVYLPEPGPMKAMMMLQHIQCFRPRKLILTFHGSEILRFHANPVYRLLTRRLIQKASRISTLTSYTETLLRERFPESEGKLFRTPGALRSDFAIVDSASPAKKDHIVVLTVGRLHPRKGQAVTLQALQALAPRFRKKIEYWIVGAQSKGNYDERLRALTADGDLKVRFFGSVADDELDEIYDRADIFAMTSIEHGHSVEGFGLVYLEAAAHGLPVVGHAVGGVSESVLDGVTGYLVPESRPAQLTAAFERLIADPELRRSMGAAGREWARRNQWVHSAQALFA